MNPDPDTIVERWLQRPVVLSEAGKADVARRIRRTSQQRSILPPFDRSSRSRFGATRLAAAIAVSALFVGMMVVSQTAGRPMASMPGAPSDPELPAPYGPAHNGVIVTAAGSALVQVDPVSRATETLFEGEARLGYYLEPEFSPDGRRLLFIQPTGWSIASVHVMDADGSNLRELLPSDDYGTIEWAPDSKRILVGLDGGVLIVDVESGASKGLDLGMVDVDVLRWRPGHDQVLISGDSDGDELYGLYLVGTDGTGLRALGSEDRNGPSPVASPDGSTVAYTTVEPSGAIHLLDIDSGVDRELSFDGSVGDEVPVAFSPDGTRLLIGQAAEGPAHAEVLRARANDILAGEFRHLIVPVSGEGPAVVLGSQVHRAIGGPSSHATFSPDGTQVLASYLEPPVGTWLFDTTTGEGELLPREAPEGVTWQRVAP